MIYNIVKEEGFGGLRCAQSDVNTPQWTSTNESLANPLNFGVPQCDNQLVNIMTVNCLHRFVVP